MGLFDSVGKFLNGGSDSSSQSTSQSGFALLPPELQQAFKQYAGQLTSQFSDPSATTNLFTPLGQTSQETSALNAISKGITPTEDTLRSDISMQMNPFDDYVINGINRQADSDYSILKQAQSAAGQLGSNRDLLGANDIEQTRLNTIGQFQQSQYNQALNNSLNQLTQDRQQDIENNFTAGDFLRGLDTQTKQAPITGLQTFGQLLGAIPQSGGSTSQSTSESSSQNGFGQTLAGLGKILALSDERLKDDIVKVGEHDGLGLYEFSYKGDPEHRRFRGVMAQEVMAHDPDAVVEVSGVLMVDYGRLGIPMMEAR